MVGRSRKKVINKPEVDTKKKDNMGEQKALPSFSVHKRDESNANVNINKSKKKSKIGVIIGFLFAVLIIVTGLLTIRSFNFNISVMLWKLPLTRGSDNVNNKSINYCGFSNGLMRVSNDGITYVKSDKTIKFTISYNMKDPIYQSAGKYFAIADRNGYEFYIFDENGLVGKNTTTNTIQKISLSETGTIYVLVSDDEKSYINAYKEDGEATNIYLSTSLDTFGMPIDISTSVNGKMLVTADTVLKDSDVYSKATFYNFDGDINVSDNRRVVGEIIDEFNDKFLARVNFFDNDNSFLMYDGGVFYTEIQDGTVVKVLNNFEFADKIKSIAYNREYLAISLDSKKIVVLNKQGAKTAEFNIGFDYDKFYIDDNYIIFIADNRVVIYDPSGNNIFDKSLEMKVQYVAKKKSLLFTELLVGLIDGVECIRFY